MIELPTLSGPDVERAGVEELIDELLTGNADIRRARLAIVESESRLRGLEGLFDTTLQGSLDLRRSRSQVESAFTRGTAMDEAYSLVATLAHRYPLGSVLSASVGNTLTHSRTPIAFGTFEDELEVGPNLGTSLTLGVQQPLLRGFGAEVNLLPRDIAVSQLDAEALALSAQASQRTMEALLLLESLRHAEAEFGLAERNLARAGQHLEIGGALLEAGRIAEFELDLLRERVASSQEAVLLSHAAVVETSRRLWTLLGRAPEEATLLLPSGEVPIPDSPGDATSLCALASRASPEVRTLEQQFATAQAAVGQSEDALRPRLDLTASYTQTGLAENWFDSWGELASFDARTWMAGLVFTMPLGNELAEEEHERALLTVDRAEFELAELRRAICSQVETAVRQRDLLGDRRAIAEFRVEIVARALEAEQERFARGLSTVQNGLDALSALESAEIAVEQLASDRAVVDLQLAHVTGELFRLWVGPRTEDGDSR